ncbi:MAG TPA: serine/threonine-protein kinase [Verrucomicrobiae bacterium]|nr:serine/threonine-protein kinase [Verrucomicrobiae bacterium]
MDPRHLQRLEAVFHGAMERSPGPQRDQYLARECANEPDLRAEVLAMIAADQEAGSSTGQGTAEEAPPEPLPLFGVFQSERILGRGGSGVVYLARRTDGAFEQAAAIKALLPEAASGVMREGFLRERNILAALHHPAIAQVLDGGIRADGTPYLVMEYVEGRRVDVYCSEQHLSLARRISLFLAVCDAVSFAHRHLVVHLDLKPSNILVTGDGHPKLLDFGTAKILDAADASVTQGLATPRYASPEQLRGERASMASDIYSLGIVLAELVTGHWPFGDAGSRMQALRRAVEDVVPLPLASLADGAQAESCGLTLPQLRRALSGDLRAVLLKALDPDPERRYRTVDEFAGDLRNLTMGLPVLARPQTRRYRVSRFLNRNRMALAIAALVLLTVGGLGGYAWIQQRRSAEQGRMAQQVNTYLLRLIQASNPRFGGKLGETVTELMETAMGQAGGMLADEPAVMAELEMVAGAHRALDRDPNKASTAFAEAVNAARRSGDPGALVATLSLKAAAEQGDSACSDVAWAAAREADEIADREGDRIKREWRATHAINRVSFAMKCNAPHTEIVALARKAVNIARSIPENSVEESTPPVVIQAYALVYAARADDCKPGEQRREAFKFFKNHPGLSYSESSIHLLEGSCLIRAGEFDEGAAEIGRAVGLLTSSVGPGFAEAVSLRGLYAWALALKGKPEAVTEARETLRLADCDLRAAICDAAKANAAQALVAMRQPGDAIPVLERLAGKAAVAPAADTCWFVLDVDQKRLGEAARYRDAARKFKDSVPVGSLWRNRIETALAVK